MNEHRTPTALPFHPDGLCLLARASASYDTLRRHLGAPTSPWDNEKTHVEWMVDTPLGPVNVYDYQGLHNCRITPPKPGERYPGGCRRNPAHHIHHDKLGTLWSVQAQDNDAVAWLDHLDGVYVTPLQNLAQGGWHA